MPAPPPESEPAIVHAMVGRGSPPAAIGCIHAAAASKRSSGLSAVIADRCRKAPTTHTDFIKRLERSRDALALASMSDDEAGGGGEEPDDNA